MKHAIRRTSPKGQPFVGTCYQCGEQNLPIGAALENCPNPKNMTETDSLLKAISLTPTTN